MTALHALEKTLWPVAGTMEARRDGGAFEIVRRRLFEPVRDASTRDAVCRAFADAYVTEGAKLPSETAGSAVFQSSGAGLPHSPGSFRSPL